MSKERNKFYIDNEQSYEIGITQLLSDRKESKEKLICSIKKDFNIDKKLSGIYFYTQNEEIIIRNVKDIKTKKEKEIIGLIKYEINQYMPIDLGDYQIKYKKIQDEMDNQLIQSILLPRNITEICRDLSEGLGLNKKYLNLDFDILDKLIKLNLVNIESEKDVVLIIENKEDNLIINKVYNKQIIESYRFDKVKDSKIKFKKLLEGNNSYFYGLNDEYIKNTSIKALDINKKLNIYPIEENNINISQYLSVLGMII